MLNYWRIYAQRLWKCLSTAMHQNSYRWSIPYLFVAFVGASGCWSIRIQQTWCLCWFIIAVHECHPQLASTPKCWLWYLRYPIPPGSHNYVGISLSLSRAILCGNICIYIYTYYVCKYVWIYIYIYTHIITCSYPMCHGCLQPQLQKKTRHRTAEYDHVDSIGHLYHSEKGRPFLHLWSISAISYIYIYLGKL